MDYVGTAHMCLSRTKQLPQDFEKCSPSEFKEEKSKNCWLFCTDHMLFQYLRYLRLAVVNSSCKTVDG